jgi:hypothetical protein
LFWVVLNIKFLKKTTEERKREREREMQSCRHRSESFEMITKVSYYREKTRLV